MNRLEKLHTRKGDKPGQAATRAAAAAGIPIRTWRDWRKGTHPPGPRNQRKLERAYTAQIILPAYRKSAQQKGTPSNVNVTAKIWWTDSDKKNNGDQRTVKFKGIKPVMAAVIRAWIAAGPEAAADAFERGVAGEHSVPDNVAEDGTRTSGVQFKGTDVKVEFP